MRKQQWKCYSSQRHIFILFIASKFSRRKLHPVNEQEGFWQSFSKSQLEGNPSYKKRTKSPLPLYSVIYEAFMEEGSGQNPSISAHSQEGCSLGPVTGIPFQKKSTGTILFLAEGKVVWSTDKKVLFSFFFFSSWGILIF